MTIGKQTSRARACAAVAAFAVAFITSLASPGGAAAEAVGTVIKVQPDSFQSLNGPGRKLDVGFDINRDARVYTKRYGSVQMLLRDGTDVLVSPNSSIVIDDYVYAGEGSAGGRFAMSLARGALRVISGRIAKEGYGVATEVAQIGVRGTRYWLDVDEPGVLKIWVDDGAVVARPVAADREFVFEAPVYAECTTTSCARTDPPPQPVKFPTDPRRR